LELKSNSNFFGGGSYTLGLPLKRGGEGRGMERRERKGMEGEGKGGKGRGGKGRKEEGKWVASWLLGDGRPCQWLRLISSKFSLILQGGPKNHTKLMATPTSELNRFSKFFN